ncbi:VAN3-binding protein-like isoform X2 [Diospyros lotus]|uniref:VAN3-binding protein-like isoform X2 n=1 Tax=Diospyros lotus TaxID=55363 RepID=UPI002258B796|nr:VAN3-binding protein-like isoform X2 [Diospyros lotus]
MEELQEVISKGVSFGSQHNLPCYKQSLSSDSSNSPISAMEFLCRPWSSSASGFQQIFSSSNLFLPLHVNNWIKELEESNAEETSENKVSRGRHINKKIGFSQMLWLKGKSLSNLLRLRREKKKEEVRLHTAKLHAALSLTQLAAAIAGFTTSGIIEAQDIEHSRTGGTTLACDQNMSAVVASAAALLTTVCAEAAESLGAKHTHVTSVVKSGLATNSPTDVITLTATAATCLRGAAMLKSRAKAHTNLARSQEPIKVGAQISIILPSGKREFKWVTICLKQRQLMLCFRIKYLGGALTATKEYKIVNITEENREITGWYSLSLKTDKGIIKLLFEDDKQSIIWISTISNLLQKHTSR